MERVGNRRGAQQRADLLLALAYLQLLHGGLFDQIALVDRLLVDDAAASGGKSNGGDQQKITHRGLSAEEITPMIHFRRSPRPV